MNYERIIQWVSGPFAVLVGAVATKLVASQGALLSAVGVSQKSAAHTVTAGVVFAVSAGVTYAGHHKWLTNAAKWWSNSGLTLPSVLESTGTPPATSGNSVTSGPTDPVTGIQSPAGVLSPAAEQLRAQLREAGITPEV